MKTALELADFPLIKILEAHPKINQNLKDQCPILQACINGNKKNVEPLIGNVEDIFYNSCIQLSLTNYQFEVTELLLKQPRADPNVINAFSVLKSLVKTRRVSSIDREKIEALKTGKYRMNSNEEKVIKKMKDTKNLDFSVLNKFIERFSLKYHLFEISKFVEKEKTQLTLEKNRNATTQLALEKNKNSVPITRT